MELTEEQSSRIRGFVAALRSGDYAQAKHQLRSEHSGQPGYCCEGVAVELYGEELNYTYEITPSGTMNVRDPLVPAGIFNAVAPPNFWVDMRLRADPGTHNGFIFILPDRCLTRDKRRSWEEYASLNDSGLTFAQIADLIEWQFLGSRENYCE